MATPHYSESNTPLFGGLGRGLLSSQHSSLIFLSLLDTWVNELWEKKLSLFHFLSQLGVLQVWFPARAQVRMLQVSSYSCLSIWPSVPQALRRRKLLSSITIIAMISQAHWWLLSTKCFLSEDWNEPIQEPVSVVSMTAIWYYGWVTWHSKVMYYTNVFKFLKTNELGKCFTFALAKYFPTVNDKWSYKYLPHFYLLFHFLLFCNLFKFARALAASILLASTLNSDCVSHMCSNFTGICCSEFSFPKNCAFGTGPQSTEAAASLTILCNRA